MADRGAANVGFRGDGITAGLGWVEVSVGVLHEVLHVPENASIVGAEFKYPGVVRLLFTAPELSHDEGEIPTVNPTITHERWTLDMGLEPVSARAAHGALTREERNDA